MNFRLPIFILLLSLVSNLHAEEETWTIDPSKINTIKEELTIKIHSKGFKKQTDVFIVALNVGGQKFGSRLFEVHNRDHTCLVARSNMAISFSELKKLSNGEHTLGAFSHTGDDYTVSLIISSNSKDPVVKLTRS